MSNNIYKQQDIDMSAISTIQLPTEIVQASTKSPEKLIIYASPKVGKTALAAMLPNNLILDLEKGSNFVSALKIQASTYQQIHAICEEIKAKGKPYRYITVDTATALEDMCLPLALALYKKTPMGGSYNGDILSLPNGAGYKYLRDAYSIMLDKIQDCCERIILLGHVKDKTVERQGKEVQSRDLDLTGKLSSITCSKADAIGFLYREGNRNMLTFETSNDIICGARPDHLKNKIMVISEVTLDGTFTTYWDKIFID